MRAEVVHTAQQMRGVEWHVNARNHDEGTLARRAGGGIGSQCSETCAGTGDGVLHTGNVVVNDFEEFAAGFRYLGNVAEDIVGTNTDLVRTKCRQAVVGVAVGIAVDQAVHGQTTGVDDFYHASSDRTCA